MTPYTREEREKAVTAVCIGGEEAALGFFTRHPNLGLNVAIDLQCELTRALELVKEYRDLADRHTHAYVLMEGPQYHIKEQIKLAYALKVLEKRADSLLGEE